MKKKLIYYVTITLTMLLLLLNTYSYAAEITKDSLTKILEDLNNDESFAVKLKINDSEIIINYDGEEYIIRYDLTDTPTFYMDTVFKDGMTYDECTDETANGMFSLFGFVLVAGINEAELEEALFYAVLSTISKTEEEGILNSKERTINKSTFIDAKDYVEKIYGKDMEIKDDLFTLSIKKAVLKGEEYNIETKVVVDTEKDFSIIKEKLEELKDATVSGSIITGIISDPATNTMVQPTSTSSTANISTMPNAGFDINVVTILKVVLGLSILALIVFSIYNKRYSVK